MLNEIRISVLETFKSPKLLSEFFNRKFQSTKIKKLFIISNILKKIKKITVNRTFESSTHDNDCIDFRVVSVFLKKIQNHYN